MRSRSGRLRIPLAAMAAGAGRPAFGQLEIVFSNPSGAVQMWSKVRVGTRAGLAFGVASALTLSVAPVVTNAQPSIPPEIAERMAAMAAGRGGGANAEREFPPFEEVSKDYKRVVSTMDDERSLYTLWTRERDAGMLAELPRNFENQRIFFTYTIEAGTPTAGIQFGHRYAYWKRFDKRLALIEPNLEVRTSGDAESRRGRDRLFTDRVLLDVPIVTMGPNGGPVIDLKGLLVGQSSKFFGNFTRGAQTSLAKITTAKAFPQNIEAAFELPVASGRLSQLHYSIRVIPNDPSYRPRKADPRVGFFTTTYRDIGKPGADTPWVRYINRWKLEKAEPNLSLSPPRDPIIFYIEHTTPIRYRRWVREGVLEWNKAFEKIGIINAIEVYQQDARTGAHMEKDPEDSRYNFVRWNNSSMGFAIGPSRVHPETGQILDAQIVLDEGFITSWARQWNQLIPEMAVEGFGPETLAWLESRPQWDPRIRLAAPGEREQILAQRQRHHAMHGPTPHAGHPAGDAREQELLGAHPYAGLTSGVSQLNGCCMNAAVKSLDVALFRLGTDIILEAAEANRRQDGDRDRDRERRRRLRDMQIPDDMPEELRAAIMARIAEMEPDEPESDNGDDPTPPAPGGPKAEEGKLDGVPEWFIGPLLKDLTMHEIGHTLGLRHNFAASTIYSLEQINSPEHKGKAITGSVMDYNPININFGDGPEQGEYSMTTIGPYDYWVIEYGYTFDRNPEKVLERVGEPELVYTTDEDTWGPDPRARRFDMGDNPLDWAESQMRLITYLREKIIDRIVEDGDPWAKTRNAYHLLLARHVNAVSTAANWVGGSLVHRDRKGDVDRTPIENVCADKQRRALNFVIDNTFNDDAFGLTSELLHKMTVDKWWDAGGFGQIFEDPTWPVHERILGIQSSAMTMLMNPSTLRRVFDNEFRIDNGEDALTLPEMLDTISKAAWSELDGRPGSRYSARQPMISSLRRNLQREHLERLIDLTMPGNLSGAASRPIATLSAMHLRDLKSRIDGVMGRAGGAVDPYTMAHLEDARTRIEKALDAQYIYNADSIGGGGPMMILFGQEADSR
ncbi:MAG: DUF5117 domain-containing protein [Phycisphaeraceae bacterium]|nr:MAG: DUF5117 domain-containing protein [Phycisphaeraceae bacterium]